MRNRRREIDEKIELRRRAIREKDVLFVGYLGIWPITAGIGKRKGTSTGALK